jgi:alkylated DNA nucleotide flippase Atl1
MPTDHRSDWDWPVDNIERIPAGYWTCYREVARPVGRPGRQARTVAVALKPMPFPDHYHRVRNVEGSTTTLPATPTDRFATTDYERSGARSTRRAEPIASRMLTWAGDTWQRGGGWRLIGDEWVA